MTAGNCRSSWYLLTVLPVLCILLGKNDLRMTPFDFISELLCLLCYGPVNLFDFVFLKTTFSSLCLCFFFLCVCGAGYCSLSLIHARQVLHHWTVPPSCSLPVGSHCCKLLVWVSRRNIGRHLLIS